MKDAVGNDLKPGDLVMLSLDRPQVFGRVVEVKEGGLITGMRQGGADVRPSIVTIASNHTIEGDPRTRVGSVLVLRDPEDAVHEHKSEPAPVIEIPN